MVPNTRSQIRNDNTDCTPAAASVNNNPITTQNIIMVQTEAERLAAIATVATAAANAAAATAVPPVVLAAQPVVQPVIPVPIVPTYLLGSKFDSIIGSRNSPLSYVIRPDSQCPHPLPPISA
jgi:hypothetical protein